jgi:hypothetical protein
MTPRRARSGWLLAFGLLAAVALPSDTPPLGATPASAQSAEVSVAIHQAAVRYGVSEQRLRCLAYRESTFRPWAYNAAGPYHGLFQFDGPTWQEGSWRAGFGGASPYDPYAASMVTGYLIAAGEGWRWPPLRWC